MRAQVLKGQAGTGPRDDDRVNVLAPVRVGDAGDGAPRNRGPAPRAFSNTVEYRFLTSAEDHVLETVHEDAHRRGERPRAVVRHLDPVSGNGQGRVGRPPETG